MQQDHDSTRFLGKTAQKNEKAMPNGMATDSSNCG
jgi:hypothetical protein